jgi:hypothetical protein
LNLVVASNFAVESAINWLLPIVNGSMKLSLFCNDFFPNPGTQLSEFVECGFTGYVAALLTGKFSLPIKTQDGEYEIDALAGPYGNLGNPQTAYGAYINDGVNVYFSARFDSPYVVQTGAYFTVSIALQTLSTSL